jgi:tetratricopeptide (TPR) repeat protein
METTEQGDREMAEVDRTVTDDAGEVFDAVRDGDAAYEDGRLDQARACYERALGASDRFEEVPVSRLAVLARETGDHASARAMFAHLGDSAENLNDLGTVAFAEGDLDEAADLWRRAVDGGCADALFNLALLAEERGDRAGEVGWLTAAADAGVTKALVNLGSIAHREGDIGRAINRYQQALQHHPDMAAFNLGVIYRDLGETDIARDWFLQAAESFNVDALVELEALAELGQLEDGGG